MPNTKDGGDELNKLLAVAVKNNNADLGAFCEGPP